MRKDELAPSSTAQGSDKNRSKGVQQSGEQEIHIAEDGERGIASYN